MTTKTKVTEDRREAKSKDKAFEHPVKMDRVASIVLGGGQGTRLFPLTHHRCKPATPFGGRYRLIDVPVSNSINSEIDKIFIITQFLSTSLHKHILSTYHFDRFSTGFVELLAAEQKPSSTLWFQGTADAVRQNLQYFVETPADYFLILSGDQLYNLDFREMLRYAKEVDAGLLIATLPVPQEETSRMGIMKVNKKQQITDFIEKPKDKETVAPFRMQSKKNGVDSYLASMGIYLFKRETLFDLLTNDPREDFGQHLIPTQIEKGTTYAYLHDGHWEDVGTIKSFYDANLALTQDYPDFYYYT